MVKIIEKEISFSPAGKVDRGSVDLQKLASIEQFSQDNRFI